MGGALNLGLKKAFHVFSDGERASFVRSLRAVLNASGTYFTLCLSDREPAGWGGPTRVSRHEIRETFGSGLKVNYIREAAFSTAADSNCLSSLISIPCSR